MSIERIGSLIPEVSASPVSPSKNEAPQESLLKFFEEFSTPEKVYPVETKNGIKQIHIAISPEAKNTKEALYRIKQESTGKSYIGMASVISERAAKHQSDFRHPEKEAGKRALPRAVQESSLKETDDDFTFGIILTKEQLPKEHQSLSLGEIEALYIDFKKTKGAPLFNKRAGGGGGRSSKRKVSKKSVAEVAEKIRAVYHTPEKSYSLDSKTHRVLLTPSAVGSLYVIKRVQELKGRDGTIHKQFTRYVGKTERPVKKRMAEHSSHARNSTSEIGQKPLYHDMRRHPKEFEVKVIDTAPLEESNLDLLEKSLIQFYSEEGEKLYNSNGGGGGGHVDIDRIKKRLWLPEDTPQNPQKAASQ